MWINELFPRYKATLIYFGQGGRMCVEWEFCTACKVKELKPNCSRNVLNINDHTVAVRNQERDGGRLAVLQSPMRTDYYAAHVLLRKPSGSRIKVRNVHTCIWCIMWSWYLYMICLHEKSLFVSSISSVWISNTGSICHTHFTSRWQLQCSFTYISLFVEKNILSAAWAFNNHVWGIFSAFLFCMTLHRGNNKLQWLLYAIQSWGQTVCSPVCVQDDAQTTITATKTCSLGCVHLLVES